MPSTHFTTVCDLLRYAVTRFNTANLFFGHGSSNAYDEAAYLILHTLKLPLDRLEPFLPARLLPEEIDTVLKMIERRAAERLPAAFLTNEAWLGGLYVHIDAVDLSADALAVAQRNVDDYALQDRIALIESDLYQQVPERRYDLIVTNPPYVNSASMEALPHEYRREPRMALAGGSDGMDLVRGIVPGAAARLKSNGVMIVEIGNEREHEEAAFLELELTWLTTSAGDDMVFLVTEEQLARQAKKERKQGGK